MADVDQAERAAREHVWALLEREHAVPPGVHGRIPSFYGAEEAADRLAGLPEWKALREGKLVYMAVPKLAGERPFIVLDPAKLDITPEEAAVRHTAVQVGHHVDVDAMHSLDLIVCGSVAVNRRGVRLGKGAGYSDIEVALLQEAGLIRPVTTIVTPGTTTRCAEPRRPQGLLWDELPAEKIAAVPALAARRRSRPQCRSLHVSSTN